MKIRAGCNLVNMRMVKLAIEQGFALKIVENAFIEGEKFDEQTGEWVHWSGTEVQVSYDYSAHDEYTIVNQYLVNGEIFAAPMSEYDEYVGLSYPHWDDDM